MKFRRTNKVGKFEVKIVKNKGAVSKNVVRVAITPRSPLYMYYPGQKKRTIIEIRGEKNGVPRVISCSIRRDQRRASPIRDCPRLLPCADRAWSSMISHVEQRSSRRESRGWFFFLARVVWFTQKTWLDRLIDSNISIRFIAALSINRPNRYGASKCKG